MPLPEDQRAQFIVFLIESPSETDLAENRGERGVIKPVAELLGIPCATEQVISKRGLVECLTNRFPQAAASYPGYVPILHVSAHGNKNGIGLSNGDVLDWIQFKEILKVANRNVGGSLILCMSTCEGYCGTRMAMHPEDSYDYPYYAIIGCGGNPTWPETAIAFMTLYHHLQRGEHIKDAVDLMRIASGNQEFWVEHAESTRQMYLEYLQKMPSTPLADLVNMPDSIATQDSANSDLSNPLVSEGK